MKLFIFILTFLLILTSLILKGQIYSDSVIITTIENEYEPMENIKIKAINNHTTTVYFMICDQFPIMMPHKLKKLSGTNWIESDLNFVCTHMGPMGYLSELDSLVVDTSFIIIETGTYKVCYDYTLHACSLPDSTDHYETCTNEFTIKNITSFERIKAVDLVEISPNPVTKGNPVLVRMKTKNNNYNFSLFNIHGIKIKEKLYQNSNGVVEIKTNDLIRGIYYLVLSGNNNVGYKLIIK